jgi:alkanesulfonate monooxygenase SsuD/methylene tetrahydromethanopterin reductase-like flavin-dependent oxidoreductase (luciferase family)
MPNFGVTMPVLGTPLDRFGQYAALAEGAGFASVWDYDFFRCPFVMLTEAARATNCIPVATGISSAFTRSPFLMANAAADLDELSGGRMILGIGTGGAEFVEGWHGASNDHPVTRMGEYIDAVRAAWRYFAGKHDPDPLTSGAKFYRFEPLPFDPWGGRELVRPTIPIYLGGMRPLMMQLAGERADALLGFAHPPAYVRDVARPNLAKGAARAGRDASTIDHIGMVICSVSRDRAEALRRARIQVGLYVANPVCDAPVAHQGLQAEQAAVREVLMSRGIDALESATDDKLVAAFSFTGTPDEVREQVADYPHALSKLVFHTPYVPPLTPDETEDAFRNIVETFAD